MILTGPDRKAAEQRIREGHYSGTVPSGKSHYIGHGGAIVVWSLSANPYLAKYLMKGPGKVWELSRLWAPDGHAPNLLTQAISVAVKAIKQLENPDLLVSFADPNHAHTGGVYRAASWVFHGVSSDQRGWVDAQGKFHPRRKFHSGRDFKGQDEVAAMGYTYVLLPGKLRFIKPLSARAKKRFNIL